MSNYIKLEYNSQEQLEQIKTGEIFLAKHGRFTWYFRLIGALQVVEVSKEVGNFRYYAETSKTTRYKGEFELVEGGKNKLYCGDELRKFILLKIATLMKEVNPKTKHIGQIDLGGYIRAIPSEFLGDKEFRSKLETTASKVIDKRIMETLDPEVNKSLGDLSEFVREQIDNTLGKVKKVEGNTTMTISAEEIKKAQDDAIKRNHKALGDGKK